MLLYAKVGLPEYCWKGDDPSAKFRALCVSKLAVAALMLAATVLVKEEDVVCAELAVPMAGRNSNTVTVIEIAI